MVVEAEVAGMRVVVRTMKEMLNVGEIAVTMVAAACPGRRCAVPRACSLIAVAAIVFLLGAVFAHQVDCDRGTVRWGE
jgi:hypothetical protein